MDPTQFDILGLTFNELSGRLNRPANNAASLRTAYRAALFGHSIARSPNRQITKSDLNLTADPHPVLRHQRDGELIKFVQRTPDGLETESVIIPMGRNGRNWHSLCVSSQVGCRMGCTFCETAQLGLLRNLSAAEIVGQVIAARREFGVEIKKIVFMGMGEPFDNFDEVIQAVRVLTDPCGLSLSKRQITISTVGRVDGIRRLGSLGWQYLQLAVSLNAPNDEIRSQIMPVNWAEPMAALREAMVAYPLRRNMYIMVEYVLIPGVNDAAENARELAEYLRPVKCCVNVIPYNPRRESPWAAPTEESVVAFLTTLREAGQFCKRRVTKGRDLMAACGQLGNRELRPNRAAGYRPGRTEEPRRMPEQSSLTVERRSSLTRSILNRDGNSVISPQSDSCTLTRAQVREVDRRAIQDYGIPGIVLMENAGRSASDIIRHLHETQCKPGETVAIVTGRGNNGGDGFVIARHLHNAGIPVTLFPAAPLDSLSDDAETQACIVVSMKLPMFAFDDDEAIDRHLAELRKAAIIVDAVLGTGFTGEVRPPLDRIIHAMNAVPTAFRVAIDVPSGLDCDTGQPSNATVRAHHTITFVARKTGFDHPDSIEFTGQIHVAGIGAPPEIVRKIVEAG